MQIVFLAAGAMFAQNIITCVLQQARLEDKSTLAGALSALSWLVSIFTTSWSVSAINGHNLGLKLAVLGAVSFANFVGSFSGTKLSEVLLRKRKAQVKPKCTCCQLHA